MFTKAAFTLLLSYSFTFGLTNNVKKTKLKERLLPPTKDKAECVAKWSLAPDEAG